MQTCQRFWRTVWTNWRIPTVGCWVVTLRWIDFWQIFVLVAVTMSATTSTAFYMYEPRRRPCAERICTMPDAACRAA
eukprot:365303-Chlamydomonas_euryale.AAC.14